MELPIYETLSDFKEYYLDALAEFPELKGNKMKLLREYQKKYNNLTSTQWEKELIPNNVLFKNTNLENTLSELQLYQIKVQLDAYNYIIPAQIFSFEEIIENEIDEKQLLKDYQTAHENFHSYKGDEDDPYNWENDYEEILRFIKDDIQNEKIVYLRNNGQIEPPTVLEDRQPKEKIIINGNRQLIGYLFNELIKCGYIEPIKFSNDTINKTATAQMFLEHFEFIDKTEQPKKDYFADALFNNSLGLDKTEYLQEHLKIPSERQMR